MSTDDVASRAAPRRHPPVGVVPLLWDLDRVPAETVLDDIRRLGLRGVQWQEPFADRVADHGLAVAEVYAAIPCDTTGPAPGAADALTRALGQLHAVGGDVLVVACDGSRDRDAWAGRAGSAGAPRLSTQAWPRLATLIGDVAERARSLGHTVAFHAHAGTWVETAQELTTLLDLTDPELVGVCLDTGHHLVGGADPVADVAAYGARITHVHLKDVAGPVLAALAEGRLGGFHAAVDQRIFCPLGDGVLDLRGVLGQLRARGYDGWLLLEQDSAWQPAVPAVAASAAALAATWDAIG